MKPFLLSISDKDSSGIPLLDWLVNALRTPLYDEALARALKIPQCQIIPFFGSFIREINYVGTHMPNLKVLAPNLQSKELQKIQKVSLLLNFGILSFSNTLNEANRVKTWKTA